MTSPAPGNNDGGAENIPAPPPVSAGEFVITDAPIPDHTATADGEDVLTSRSPNRTEALKALAAGKRGPGRPRKERAEKPAKPAAVAPRGGFVGPLTEMYGFVALAIMPFDANCAMAIMQAAPEAAKSLDNLAKTNPAVKRVLIAITQTSAWGAVITAHLPIIIAITVHHVPAVKNSNIGAMLSAGIANPQTPEENSPV